MKKSLKLLSLYGLKLILWPVPFITVLWPLIYFLGIAKLIEYTMVMILCLSVAVLIFIGIIGVVTISEAIDYKVKLLKGEE